MRSKLGKADVAEIRRLRAAGVAQRALADKFGITQGHVSRICSGGRWPAQPNVVLVLPSLLERFPDLVEHVQSPGVTPDRAARSPSQ